MKTFKPSHAVIALLNLKVAYSILLGVAAFFLWPSSLKFYGFGLVSILVGAAAAGLAINVISQIFKILPFEKDQEEFQAQGNAVKSSTLLSKDFLTKKGVIRK